MSLSMIEETSIDDAIDCYNMGKDIRLYRQDKLIQKIRSMSLIYIKDPFERIIQKASGIIFHRRYFL